MTKLMFRIVQRLLTLCAVHGIGKWDEGRTGGNEEEWCEARFGPVTVRERICNVLYCDAVEVELGRLGWAFVTGSEPIWQHGPYLKPRPEILGIRKYWFTEEV